MTVKFATTRHMAQGLKASTLQDRRAHMAVIDVAMRWNARCTFTCANDLPRRLTYAHISNLHARA